MTESLITHLRHVDLATCRVGNQSERVLDAQSREEAAAFGDVRQAAPHDLVAAQVGDLVPIEDDAPAHHRDHSGHCA